MFVFVSEFLKISLILAKLVQRKCLDYESSKTYSDHFYHQFVKNIHIFLVGTQFDCPLRPRISAHSSIVVKITLYAFQRFFRPGYIILLLRNEYARLNDFI